MFYEGCVFILKIIAATILYYNVSASYADAFKVHSTYGIPLTSSSLVNNRIKSSINLLKIQDIVKNGKNNLKTRKEILRRILEDRNDKLIKDLVKTLPAEDFLRRKKDKLKDAHRGLLKKEVTKTVVDKGLPFEEETSEEEYVGQSEPTQINHVRNGSYIYYKNEIFILTAIQHIAQARTKGHYKVKMQGLHSTRETSHSMPDSTRLTVILPEKSYYTYESKDVDRGVHVFKGERFNLDVPSNININSFKYLKPGLKVVIMRWKEHIISIHVPFHIEYKVVHVNPGNYAATLDNGLVVPVPTYIKPGDHIEVNTTKCEFLRRSQIS